jgi:hypothetical protein
MLDFLALPMLFIGLVIIVLMVTSRKNRRR